jgi:hypothetical protein
MRKLWVWSDVDPRLRDCPLVTLAQATSIKLPLFWVPVTQYTICFQLFLWKKNIFEKLKFYSSTIAQMYKKQWQLSIMLNPSALVGDQDCFSQDQPWDWVILPVLRSPTWKKNFLDFFPLQQVSVWLQLDCITNNCLVIVKRTSITGTLFSWSSKGVLFLSPITLPLQSLHPTLISTH